MKNALREVIIIPNFSLYLSYFKAWADPTVLDPQDIEGIQLIGGFLEDELLISDYIYNALRAPKIVVTDLNLRPSALFRINCC